MHRHTRCWRKINRDCSAMHPCLIAGSTANIGVHTPLLFCGRDIRRMFGQCPLMHQRSCGDYKAERKFISASRKISMQALKFFAMFLGTRDGWRCKGNTLDHRWTLPNIHTMSSDVRRCLTFYIATASRAVMWLGHYAKAPDCCGKLRAP